MVCAVSALFLSSYDWKGAFDRLDPTEVAVKMIKLGLRSSIVKIIIDFFNERKMEVKMNKHTSTTYDLIGGGPQVQCCFGNVLTWNIEREKIS